MPDVGDFTLPTLDDAAHLDLSLERLMKSAWRLLKPHLLAAVGIWFTQWVLIKLCSETPGVGWAVAYLLSTVGLMARIYFFFNCFRHQPVTFDEFWNLLKGKPTLLLGPLVESLLVVTGFVFLVIPGFFAWVALWLFFPLLIATDAPLGETLKSSITLIKKNFWKWVPVVIVLAVLRLPATIGSYAWTPAFVLGVVPAALSDAATAILLARLIDHSPGADFAEIEKGRFVNS